MIAALAFSRHSSAQDERDVIKPLRLDVSPAETRERETLGVRPYLPLRRFSEAGRMAIDTDGQWALAIAAVTTATAAPFDDDAYQYFGGRGRIGELNQLGNRVLGTGVAGAVLGAGFWLAGEFSGHPYAAHAGQAQLETLLATGLLTSALKSASNRQRPDGSNHYSFPSAHTAYAFATAEVLNQFYGWKVGVPGYLLGALTAVSRLQDNRHWLSDTVGGAALAIVIARAVSRAHLHRFKFFSRGGAGTAQPRLHVLPVLSPRGDGLSLSVRLEF